MYYSLYRSNMTDSVIEEEYHIMSRLLVVGEHLDTIICAK